MTPTQSPLDVCVVGAGIAGLAVATRLFNLGFSVTVLEARSRVGGRLLSHQVGDGVAGSGAQLDLGATWFWPGEQRVIDLVQSLHIDTHDHYLSGDAAYHQPQGSQRLDGNPIDVASWRFSGGAASLTDGLAALLPPGALHLDCSVRAIGGTEEILEIEHDGGSVRARHVVLALPPALATHMISFDPPLDPAVAALASKTPVWMGAIAKAVIVYGSAFWREQGLAGSAISHVGPLREIHDMSGPGGAPAALFGFAPMAQSGELTAEAVRLQLVEIFGPAAGSPHEIAICNWRDEPNTSPPHTTRLTDYSTYGHRQFQEPTGGGRVHWASTETSIVAPGHIEGALAAAERVTAVIAEQLGATIERTKPTPVTRSEP